MKRTTWTMSFWEHDGLEGLAPADQVLLAEARSAAARAYAPYSRFHVGAALRLVDGQVVSGSNQENASFPAGICAERTALHAALSSRPEGVVETMAVVVPAATDDRPVSPCGICRQALLEQEHRQGRPLRILLGTSGGRVVEVASARDLLPLSFDATFLKP